MSLTFSPYASAHLSFMSPFGDGFLALVFDETELYDDASACAVWNTGKVIAMMAMMA